MSEEKSVKPLSLALYVGNLFGMDGSLPGRSTETRNPGAWCLSQMCFIRSQPGDLAEGLQALRKDCHSPRGVDEG
jgi:hypothetical protein